MKNWNTQIKNVVRASSFAPFRGKRYPVVVDLPGNQCLSVQQALRNNTIAEDGCFRLAENDHIGEKGKVYAEIEKRMSKLGVSQDRYSLFHDNLEQMDFEEDEEVGLLNCDLMTQPSGFDVQFLDRVPYQLGAGVICTFQNHATRRCSELMRGADELMKDIESSSWDYWKRQYHAKQYGLTMSRTGKVIREPELAQNFYESGLSVLACVVYGMRNHDFRLNRAITYSGHLDSLAFRMTTIILTGVYRRGDHEPSRLSPGLGRHKQVEDAATLNNMKEYFRDK